MSPGSQNISSIEQSFKPNILKLKLYKTTTFNNIFYLKYIKISIMFSNKYVVSKEKSAKLHLKFYVKITVFYSVIFFKNILKFWEVFVAGKVFLKSLGSLARSEN